MNWTLKFVGLLSVLLIGVALGLNTAERGIAQVNGSPEQKPQAFYIKKLDKGKMEIAAVGKPAQTIKSQGVNYMSRLGDIVGGWVKSGARSMIDWLSTLFQP